MVLLVRHGISSPAEEDVCVQRGDGEGASPTLQWVGSSSGQNKAELNLSSPMPESVLFTSALEKPSWP